MPTGTRRSSGGFFNVASAGGSGSP
jgi:hypothetical protein